jgi:ribosome maturation protein Sdo1
MNSLSNPENLHNRPVSLERIESSLTTLHINNIIFRAVEEQTENISIVLHTFVHTA